jgi:AcrR family transcriptional regulator
MTRASDTVGPVAETDGKEDLTRGARRRARMRARLIEAARIVFARQGVDATRINEITEEADVGFGSFYNHFSSKEEIVAAVLEQAVASHGEAVNEFSMALEDPAEIVAVAHRHFASLARTDPDTAWLLIRLEPSHRVLAGALRSYAARDIARGVATRRFAPADPDVALHASGGSLLGVMRAILEGELGADAEVAHAEGVLRTLGVDPAEASEVARRALPQVN